MQTMRMVGGRIELPSLSPRRIEKVVRTVVVTRADADNDTVTILLRRFARTYPDSCIRLIFFFFFRKIPNEVARLIRQSEEDKPANLVLYTLPGLEILGMKEPSGNLLRLAFARHFVIKTNDRNTAASLVEFRHSPSSITHISPLSDTSDETMRSLAMTLYNIVHPHPTLRDFIH